MGALARGPTGSRRWRAASRTPRRHRDRSPLRMRRPVACARSTAARGKSISANAFAPARSRRACSSGSSGRGNGRRSIVTSDRLGPGTSMPCQKPIVANRQDDVLLGEAARASLGFGSSPWARIVWADPRPQLGGCRLHRPPRREQRERAPAGGLDERGELVVERGLVARVGAGREGARRSRGARAPRSRRGCRRRAARSCRRARRGVSAACGATSRS